MYNFEIMSDAELLTLIEDKEEYMVRQMRKRAGEVRLFSPCADSFVWEDLQALWNEARTRKMLSEDGRWTA